MTILADARGYGKRAAAAAIALDWLAPEARLGPATTLGSGTTTNKTTSSGIRRDFYATAAMSQSVGTTIDGYLRSAAATVPVDSEVWVKGALAAWRSSMKSCTYLKEKDGRW